MVAGKISHRREISLGPLRSTCLHWGMGFSPLGRSHTQPLLSSVNDHLVFQAPGWGGGARGHEAGAAWTRAPLREWPWVRAPDTGWSEPKGGCLGTASCWEGQVTAGHVVGRHGVAVQRPAPPLRQGHRPRKHQPESTREGRWDTHGEAPRLHSDSRVSEALRT